ncbi:hypothetical protein J3R83DRAFT_1487 [Lanmaoa asiatica]|nr:hypothetical protein J3R83DRAFT_1487 [Lanmaoa asiatica]
MFAINSGIWTAICSLLAAILVRLSLVLCRTTHFERETITMAGAYIIIESDLCHILCPALFDLLQHTPRQPQCQDISSRRNNSQKCRHGHKVQTFGYGFKVDLFN